MIKRRLFVFAIAFSIVFFGLPTFRTFAVLNSTIRMEAETDAQRVYYSTTEAGGTGTVVGGGLGIDTVQSYSNIQSRGLQKTSYVQYYVLADEDGQYDITVGARLGAENDINIYKTAVVVNNGFNGNVYEANYTFENATKNVHQASCSLKVNLVKGMNTISCTNTLSDMNAIGAGWAYVNQDYLDIDSRLHPQKMTRMQAETNSHYSYYNKTESAGTGTVVSDGVGVNDAQDFNDIKIKGLGYISYAQYYVSAPEAGNYYITLGGVMGAGKVLNSYKTAIVVNNGTINNVYKANYDLTEDKKFVATARCSVNVKLNKGINIISCTSPLKDMYTSDIGYAYINQDYLDISDSLTPLNFDRYEAENASEKNLYGDSSDGGTKKVLGGAKGINEVQSFNDIVLNGLGYTSYVKYTVSVENEGKYQITLGGDLGSGSTLDKYETAVIVNQGGKSDTYRADYTFDNSTSRAKTGRCTLKVNLKKGQNDIYCTCTLKDMYIAGVAWAYINQDYLDINTSTYGNIHQQLNCNNFYGIPDGNNAFINDKLVLDNENKYKEISTDRNGYRFLGFYTDSNLTNAINYEDDIDENVLLFAKWSKFADINGDDFVDLRDLVNIKKMNSGKIQKSCVSNLDYNDTIADSNDINVLRSLLLNNSIPTKSVLTKELKSNNLISCIGNVDSEDNEFKLSGKDSGFLIKGNFEGNVLIRINTDSTSSRIDLLVKVDNGESQTINVPSSGIVSLLDFPLAGEHTIQIVNPNEGSNLSVYDLYYTGYFKNIE